MVWHIGKGAFWFHEVKSGKGAPSDGQVEFKEDCEACGVVCLVGGEEVARDYLREIGVLI